MNSTSTLIARNKEFSKSFSDQDLPMLPKLRTVILACPDARVDPTHIMKIDLGEAVTIRAMGARITQDVINEISTIAFMAAKMDQGTPKPFELIIVQHTQCGAERFAHPEVQAAIKHSQNGKYQNPQVSRATLSKLFSQQAKMTNMITKRMTMPYNTHIHKNNILRNNQ